MKPTTYINWDGLKDIPFFYCDTKEDEENKDFDMFNGGIYRIRHILQERGSRIRIESSPEISVEVDGELLGETPLEFSILHKAIRIVVSKEFYDRRPETSCSCTVPEV